MNLYYISTEEHNREIRNDWHALPLGNGKWLTCVRWKDEAHEVHWSNHPDVVRLPHPIFESTVQLTGEHLEHLNARYKTLAHGHTIHDMIRALAPDDPWMRLHIL